MSEELKPCPFCGSDEITLDSTGVQTTFDGPAVCPTGWHEYQSSWGNVKNVAQNVEM